MDATQATLIEGTKRIDLASPDPLAAQTSATAKFNDDETISDLNSLAIDLDDVAPLADDVMTGDDVNEDTETRADTEKAAPVKSETTSDTVLTGPLASLPNREALRESFDEILERGQSSASLSMMAIQCHGESNATAMRSLLQIIRATLRSVDRLGYANASTLLVCMPSVDQATAESRGQQICRSASAIGLKQNSANEHAISVGIAPAVAESDFDDVVDVSMEMAVRGKNADAEQVIFADEPATV